MKKVYIIHTSLVSYEELNSLFKDIVPEAKVFNIVDDSLLADVMANVGITPKIIARLCSYYKEAENNGADLIFNQCSSVGDASDIAANIVNVDVVKVDEAMAENAVAMGSDIAVIATVKSTMKPSCNLIKNKAKLIGKDIMIKQYLVDGALDILMKEKDKAKHNRLVIEKIKEAEKHCDVIVLAQGSMTALLDDINNADIKKHVLTSPYLGVMKARDILLKNII